MSITFHDITVTKARNNFFNLINESYLEGKTFVVTKGGIPVAYISPPHTFDRHEKNKDLDILNQMNALRSKQKMGTNSVEVIREIRNHE